MASEQAEGSESGIGSGERRPPAPRRRQSLARMRRVPRPNDPGPPSRPEAGASVDLYEVLLDSQHPAFSDLGRLLWTMIATQTSWVDRRVETASLSGERRFRRHMSVDCRVPPSVLELAFALGFNRFLVPLRFVTKKGALLAFDLRLDDQSVPWLTRSQNTAAATSVLHAAVDQLGAELTPELEAVLAKVAGTDESAAEEACRLLRLTEPARSGASATVEELVHWLFTTLDHNFLLLADVGVQQIRRRTVFKITQELGLRVQEPLPIRAQIAWDPTSFVFDTPDVTAASSYHFQFVAPDGMAVSGGGLFAAALDSEVADGVADGRRQRFGTASSQGSVLGLNTHIHDVPEAATFNVEVLVRPSADGLVRACAVSAAFSAGLLTLAAIFANRLGDRLDASTAMLLVLPGVVSTFLARPGEHHLVGRLLRGVRTLAIVSGITVYSAAALLVAGVSGGALRASWAVLAGCATIPAGVLLYAVRRCRKDAWSG